MPRLAPQLPSYRLHKASGRAVVTLSGRDIYLGAHGSRESRDRYQQVVAEWLANHQAPPASSRSGALCYAQQLCVDELFVSYWRFCEGYYLDNGKPARTLANIRAALRPIHEGFGSLPVRDVRPSTLKAARQGMIDAGLSRKTINDRINRIRHMFRWGVENDLVPPQIAQALQAVAPLRRGRSGAREGRGVQPVPEERVEATLPHLPPTVRAMVRVQQYTGMRPGELVLMRPGDLDRSAEPWVYRPIRHKTEIYGRSRAIYIGRRAQAHLATYLEGDAERPVFSPRCTMDERFGEKRVHRHQPVLPPRTRRKLRDRYTTSAYLRAIYYACDAAFPPPPELRRGRVPGRRGERWETAAEWRERIGEHHWRRLEAWRKEHRWHPNQLRHSAATHLRKQFGIEAARIVLGHSSAAVTEIYAELDQQRAAEIMDQVG